MTTTISSLLVDFIVFVNDLLVPLILAIAFLFFLWNTFQYFIAQGATKEGREKARRSAFYSIAAFVLIVILWGVVNLLVEGLGFDRTTPIHSDFIELNS
ncbi:hypothetical protein KTR10_00010 [Candidatus Kaiserbacteria bacterium]|nr:hypothetical protein [Candidatus Kaiserbacteria bacterium]